jgi:hypothetical protein
MSLERDLGKMREYIEKQLDLEKEEEYTIDQISNEEFEEFLQTQSEVENQPEQEAESQPEQEVESQPEPQPKKRAKRRPAKRKREIDKEEQQPLGAAKPDKSELLKKAKFALTDEEAERYYNEVLELDLENVDAWYGKFLLKSKKYAYIKEELPCDPWYMDKMKPWEFIEQTVQEHIKNRDRLLEDMKKVLDPYSKLPHSDDINVIIKNAANRIDNSLARSRIEKGIVLRNPNPRSIDSFLYFTDWTWPALEALREAARYFRNAWRAAPDQFVACEKCKAKGYTKYSLKSYTRQEKDSFATINLCFACRGMGHVRMDNVRTLSSDVDKELC